MVKLDFRLVILASAVASAIVVGCATSGAKSPPPAQPPKPGLTAVLNETAGTVSISREGHATAIVTATASPDARPYIHPIAAPDGKGVLTEDSPSHHKHQTGLYWGFTRVNGRDFFHNLGRDYWQRVSVSITQARGDEVGWQTVYHLLDASGAAMLTETTRWTLRETDGTFLLDLDWRGLAHTDVTIGKYDYGGLFLRMPWRQGLQAEVVNAARQRDTRAEGQRAMWIDVGVQVDGRTDLAHVAMFDHPDNIGYPQAWRVDGEFGVGAARSRAADWAIKKGQTEVIRHRLLAYTGTLDDVKLTDLWSAYTGNRSTYATQALWGLAQREGRLERFLKPEEAAAAMTALAGYTVNAWAGEPMVQQPMAFCWDDRGRLWVAENLDYETRGRGFSNSGKSRITILEDTDRDGVADSRKIFMEGIVFPSALAVGLDGVFVGAPPNLLFVPDRDGDDRADMADIEVRLTGWGIQDRHEVINSLHWGPDGWLYGLQGFATSSKVRKPVGKGRLYAAGESFPDVLEGDGVEINGGVWRYHPTKDRFEIVAHGFSNPWGIDYDAKGQLLMSACVIPHLWHVVPGGVYQRQGGRHFNPYIYGDIQTIADHRHRSAHGGARVYQSDAFPASQRGRIFMANIHEHAVLSDVLERKGSGFLARHGDDFAMANNAQWVGFSLEIGPDGALYVLDWHDADICGADVLNHQTGRIFKIAPRTSLAQEWPGRYDDLRRLSDGDLVALQRSPSDWHARRARVLLQGRAARGTLGARTHDDLRRVFTTDSSPDVRLRAMWSLHVTGGWTSSTLADVLGDSDEYIRAWAIQLLTEDGTPSSSVLETFARIARDDRSPVVRLYLAAALQRVDRRSRWSIAEGLLAHAEDSSDQNLPTLLWIAVEPLVAENPALALTYAGKGRIPLVARYVARRTVDADRLEPLVAAIGSAPAMVQALLEGMRDGLEGRVDLSPPPNWPQTFHRLRRSTDTPIASVVREVAERFGDTEAARRNLAAVRTRTTSITERRRAVQVLSAQRRPELVAELPQALGDTGLRVEAIRAIAAYDDPSLGKALLARFPSFTAAEKAEAVQTLASRVRYARLLTEAIASGAVAKHDVPAYVAPQLRRVVGPKFADVWGAIDRDPDQDRVHARYRGILTDAAIAGANLASGREVFQRTCGACHKLYGEGGTVGPDLTGSNRQNLDYLLANVLDPNADVAEGYRMVVITTRDGQTYTGNVVSETDRQLTLRVVARDPVVISKANIQAREATPTSMMPPGLFDALPDRDVINLVAYLRTVAPSRRP
jgi:putative membrane-bound dehydrogenase-like protein